jgi:hypothetical protein
MNVNVHKTNLFFDLIFNSFRYKKKNILIYSWFVVNETRIKHISLKKIWYEHKKNTAGHLLLFPIHYSLFRYFNAAICYRYSATFLTFAICFL